VYAALKEYHVRRNVEHDPRALGESASRGFEVKFVERSAAPERKSMQ
jgi:hypothetical protein